MSNVNYAAMTHRKLKRYILTDRDDGEAFYAYVVTFKAQTIEEVRQEFQSSIDDDIILIRL